MHILSCNDRPAPPVQSTVHPLLRGACSYQSALPYRIVSALTMSKAPLQLLGGDPTSIGDAAVFGVITVSDRASSGVYEDLSGPAIIQFFQDAIQSPWEAKYTVIPDEQVVIEQTIKDMVSLDQYASQSTVWHHQQPRRMQMPRDTEPSILQNNGFAPMPSYKQQISSLQPGFNYHMSWSTNPATIACSRLTTIPSSIITSNSRNAKQFYVLQADKQGCCLIVTTGGTGPAPRDVTPEATEAVCERMLPGYGEQMRAISLKYVATAVLSRQTAGADTLAITSSCNCDAAGCNPLLLCMHMCFRWLSVDRKRGSARLLCKLLWLLQLPW